MNGRSPAFMGSGIRFRRGRMRMNMVRPNCRVHTPPAVLQQLTNPCPYSRHTWHGMTQVWEIGDMVVQVPWDCFPVPDCINGGNQTYLYAHHGGLVKVLPSMMPNEDSWIKESVR